MYFAIKQLQKSEALKQTCANSYNREIKAYKRLNSIQHSNIVRLLATYSHQDRLHMIFPWANGNLYQFWEQHFPDVPRLPRGHGLAKWMIDQCFGLADGLRCIHKSEIDPASDELQPEDQKRTHGRHGDIKPENVLWFKNPAGTSTIDRLGNLMISDLGSTEFHGTFSKNVQVLAAGGFTETYKSPEFDFAKQITPQSDIWSFGCVLFQFIVWYVLGWHGVEDFTEQRKKDSNFVIPSDHFFNFYKDENSVKAKASVRKVRHISADLAYFAHKEQAFTYLRENSASSDFIMDLLDLVENHLLRLRVSQRASCEEIVSKLKTIKDLCDRNEQYCVQKTPRDFVRTATELSDKLVQVSLSDEMKDEYIRNINPDSRIRPVPSETMIKRPAASEMDDERSRTGEEVSDDTPNASGLQIKPFAVVDTLHTENSAPTVGPGETARYRIKTYKGFRSWIRNLTGFCC